MSMLPHKGNPYGQITEKEVKTRGPERPAEFTDEAALKLVVQDSARAENWLQQKQWSLMWREIDILYQSPRSLSTWEGTGQPTANVSRFTVATHVNSILPEQINGVFYEDPPFVLRPSPEMDQDTVRAKTVIIGAELREMEFKTESEAGLFSQSLFGTGIWKWGIRRVNKIEKQFRRKQSPVKISMPLAGTEDIHTDESDEFEVVEVTKRQTHYFCDQVDLRHLRIDPGWRKPDIRKAGYVIHEQYLTFNDLNDLRDDPDYNIPPEDELKALFFPPKESPIGPAAVENVNNQTGPVHHAAGRNEENTADPLEHVLLVEERVDNDRIITVVQKKLVIRNSENPFHCINYFSCNWWNIPDAGYGIGPGRLVGQDQRIKSGVTNAALNILSLAVNQTYLRDTGANIPTQQIRQRLGGILDVKVPAGGDVRKAFAILETPKVPPETWTVLQSANAESEAASGANEILTQGAMPTQGRTSMGRTATGAGNMASATAARLEGPLGRFIDQVFIPWIYKLDELIKETMPVEQIKEILGDKLGKGFQADLEKIFNARCDFEVLAGAHMAAKKAMAQAIPFLVQLAENPQVIQQLNAIGYVLDIDEILKMFMEVSGWKNNRNVIREMTPQEKQAFQAQNPGMQKIQGQMALNNQTFQQKQQLTDQENEARLARSVVENSLDKATGEELRSGDKDMMTGSVQ